MDSKTISLSEDVYSLLKNMRREGESFNEVILRLLQESKKKDIMKLKGSWKGSDEETEKILDLIYKNRDKATIPR
ncbi:MAG: hypothetical protein BAJALOKI2v1_250041 [Promethearchaeota archaeon]|nr:MAG: hypothetical protein BAJALOKI2v1_250041 [Candidatus Lokiarchaeota archaeon]